MKSFFGWSFFLLSFQVSAQISAGFNIIVPSSNCNPAIYSFANTSTGTGLNYQWNFGVYPGVNSIFPNPSTTYLDCGSFNVQLVVTDQNGQTDSITKVVNVRCSPTPSFTSVPGTGCLPYATEFNSTSTAGSGSIVNHIWDFGDGIIGSGSSPDHLYTVPGCKNVSLIVVNSFNCVSDTTINSFICTYEPPEADFTSGSTVNCSAPFDVTYQAFGQNGTLPYNYQWFFEGGAPDTSTLATPTVTYNTLGRFSATLIITDVNGCADTVVKDDYVEVREDSADFTMSQPPRCAPGNVTLNGLSTGNPIAWNWEVAPNAVINDSTATNTSIYFSDAGSYEICLRTTYIGGCVYERCTTIVVNESPTANFGVVGALSTCVVPNEITYIDSSSGNGLFYNWSFPGGTPPTSDSIIPPAVSYTNCGNYSASLIVTDSVGCTAIKTLNNFLELTCDQASYAVSPSNGCLPLTANFVGSSTGNPVSWIWDFDDPSSGANNTSTLQNPSHTFYSPGCYNVTLTTIDADSCVSTYTLDAAVCAGFRPQAAFSGLPPYNCARLPVTLADSSTGTFQYTEYVWLFYDSAQLLGSSVEQNPNYTFDAVGIYDITLIVSNYGCADTITKDDYIQTFDPVSVPEVIQSCDDSLSVILDGTGSSGAQEYAWIILGGTPASATTPTVQVSFPAPGDYNASLYVENDTTGCSDLQNVVVHITGLSADFSGTPLSGCAPLQSCMSNVSSNAVNYEWRVYNSNGQLDTSANISSPCFVFDSIGTYSVELIATDASGCIDTIFKEDYISVTDPKPAFAANPKDGCAPLLVEFTDSSKVGGSEIASWNWNFGDLSSGSNNTSSVQHPNHVYASAGLFSVSLSITDSNGCTSDTFKSDYIQVSKPDASFTSNSTAGCLGTETCFEPTVIDSSVSYHWDFGDGNTSDSALACHLFTGSSYFNVTLITTDSLMCRDTTTKIETNQVIAPVADLAADTTSSTCPPLTVAFSNLSADTDTFTTWRWDFGDGQVSSLKDPFHIYTQSGNFTVSLVATNFNGCSDTIVYVDYINISGPSAFVATPPVSGCVPHTTCMSAISVSATTFTWNLGDGTVINGTDSICFTYNRFGSFFPELILSDGNNCVFSLPMGRVDVNGVEAAFSADQTAFCQEGTVNFTDLSQSTTSITEWSWNFGDQASGSDNFSNDQHPTHNYMQPGDYQVVLMVTSDSSCADTAFLNITVFPLPQLSIGLSDSSLCEPDSAHFFAEFGSDSIVSIVWDFGDPQSGTANSSMNINPAHYYEKAGDYIVILGVVDTNGCSGSDSLNVTIRPLPNVNDLDIQPADGCPPLDVRFEVNALHADFLRWDFGDGTFSTEQLTSGVSHIYPDSGKYVVGLYARSQYGCIDSFAFDFDTITVYGLPVADFDISINGWQYPYDGTINFINQSINANSYLWAFGDGDISTEVNPSHQYPNIGNYTALLTAFTTNGCLDTAQKSLFAYRKSLYVPNALNPNNDGSDDLVKVWKPAGIGLKAYHAQIFDQWGKLLWESEELEETQPAEHWDGTYNGEPSPQDVYVWKIEAVFLDGMRWPGMRYRSDQGGGVKTIGSVTLIR